MDCLPPETQEQLKKMSSTRLAAKLGKAGFDVDCLEQLEQTELLEAMAEMMLKEPTAESKTDFIRKAREASQVSLFAGDSSGTGAAVCLRELELEEKQAERDREEPQAEREKRKTAREAEERKA